LPEKFTKAPKSMIFTNPAGMDPADPGSSTIAGVCSRVFSMAALDYWPSSYRWQYRSAAERHT
jgi:hypothetical protein